MNSEIENQIADAGATAATAPASPGPGELRKRKPAIWLALAVLLAVLAGGAYLYSSGKFSGLVSGRPKAGEDAAAIGGGTAKPLKALSDEQLERMVGQALAQTQKEPKNASAWAMLAHTYGMLGKFAESAKAYATLTQLLPNDAQVLADYADVLAVVNGRSFKGEPAALLKRALALDSKNAKALVLAGSEATENEAYAQAISYLERARAAATDPVLQRQIEASIGQTKVLAGDASAAAPAPAQGKASATAGSAAAPAQVSGRVWLADDLRAKAPAQATLFVYARPLDGSRMPVALLRKKVSDLPLNFTLDDSMAMVPDVSLSKLSAVVVVARISARGNVTPAAGDLEGVSAPVAVGSKDLKLEITEVLK